MPFSLQSASKLSSRQQLVKAGKMFIATNPTPGTAIAHATLTAFSATANGLFLVQNTNASGGPNIYLDRILLCQTATAPTGTLVKHFEVYNETGLVAFTGNFAARTPVNLNPSFTNTTGAVVHSFAAGAGTIAAAVGTRRLMDVFTLVTGVTVIHDTFIVDFSGNPTAGKSGATAARATDAAELSVSANPVCITPQTTSWINMWWVTQATNVPSYEFALTYSEILET